MATSKEQPKSPAIVVGFAAGAVAGAALIALAVLAAFGWVPGVHRPDYSNVSAGDVASLAVAGATLLLADFTAMLAWLTRRSLAATRREAEIAEGALAASNRQAATAEKALAAAEEQAKVSGELVKATNEQSRIAQAQLVASWRPILADPFSANQKDTVAVEIRPDLKAPYKVSVFFHNIGVGPAFPKKGVLALGVAIVATTDLGPSIVPPGGRLVLVFTIDPSRGVDIAITNAATRGQSLQAGVFYHDVSGEHAWLSRGRLAQKGTYQWVLIDVEASEVALTDLK